VRENAQRILIPARSKLVDVIAERLPNTFDVVEHVDRLTNELNEPNARGVALSPRTSALLATTQNSGGEGLPHYLDELESMAVENLWTYGTHYDRMTSGCVSGQMA
jgi:hypothetical protein